MCRDYSVHQGKGKWSNDASGDDRNCSDIIGGNAIPSCCTPYTARTKESFNIVRVGTQGQMLQNLELLFDWRRYPKRYLGPAAKVAKLTWNSTHLPLEQFFRGGESGVYGSALLKPPSSTSLTVQRSITHDVTLPEY